LSVYKKSRSIDAAVVEYAKEDCKAFCAAFHSALPPELREMVYEELWSTNDHRVHVWVSTQGNSETFGYFDRVKGLLTDGLDNIGKLYYLDPEFSGVVATDLVQRIYRTSHYRFDVHELCLMERFLTTDVYGVGVVPGNFVQHIKIKLRRRWVVESEGTVAMVIQGLEKLSTMENRFVQVEIEVPGPLRGVINFTEHIAGTIYKLRAVGFNMKIIWGIFPSRQGQPYQQYVIGLSDTLEEFLGGTISQYRLVR
jgi:hypothetical protein